MNISISLALTEGASLSVDDIIVFFNSPVFYYWPPTGLRFVSPGVLEAFRKLATGGAARDDLEAIVVAQDGARGMLALNKWLNILNEKALLARTLVMDGTPLATLQPISPYFHFTEQPISAEQAFELSRFACARKDKDELLLESARGHAVLRIHGAPQMSAVFFELCQPRTAEALAHAIEGLELDAARHLLNFMLNAVIVTPHTAEGASEDDDPSLGPWAFHDMLFHVRSRLGRHAATSGGYYAQSDRFPPPPIVKPRMSKEIITLYKPDIYALKENDLPFTRVLETRASSRKYGKSPINIDQLGEFLFRAARVKKLVADAGLSFRPYAGCGGIYSLDIYPFINQCEGIEAGIYNYDPLEHQLCRLSELNQDAQKLLRIASGTALLDDSPQVLLVITARFQRTQTKYRHTAYSMILQDVGSLYQTLYLVAQAMELAPVALGGGYPDLFTQATGLEYFQETSVGEFIIGSTAVNDSVNKAMAEGGVFVDQTDDFKGGYGKGVIGKPGC